MTRDEFFGWSKQHATAFGLGEPGAAMTGAWFKIFKGFGYTIAELNAATFAMAKAPPEFASQHLARINQAIAEARADAARTVDPAPGDRGTCTICGNGGWVTVPHQRYVVNGQWRERHTAAVTCSCWFGRRIVEANDTRRAEARKGEEPPQPMRLDEYQQVNPNWRQQLDEYEHARAAYCHEIGPALGRADEWARLSAAIDKAMQAVARTNGRALAKAGTS